jgi:hypothetical protein
MKKGTPTSLTRRDMLKGMAGFGAAAALPGCLSSKTASDHKVAAADRPVHRENRRPGTRDWMLAKHRIERGTKYRSLDIEGFCSRTSVRAGQPISFFVSTNPASEFTIDLYRMGYYGGAGGRHVRSLGPFRGQAQPEPPIGARRVRECVWEACVSLVIPRSWLSGVYLGKLTSLREGFQSYLIFIVRDDRQADLLFQCSDTTWQAYNRWPNQFALYDDGRETWYCGPGVDVSFDRPYGKYCQILDAPLSIGSGEWFLWEFPFAYWLEAEGYDVTYISNLDTHADGPGLMRAKGFLSVGHDEYYSIEMYDNLTRAIEQGLNVGFFSGNTCCGRIDPRPGKNARPHRVFGRVDHFGPRDEPMIQRFPSIASFPYQSPAEGLLIGARSNVAPCTGGADWVCSVPEHWIYAGTGMAKGETIPGLIGWEFHGDPPSIAGLEIVATGPVQDAPGKPNGGIYTATVYPGAKGNFVFNASTCWWSDGLAEPPGYVRPAVYTKPQGPDKRVQAITRNILRRML